VPLLGAPEVPPAPVVEPALGRPVPLLGIPDVPTVPEFETGVPVIATTPELPPAVPELVLLDGVEQL
jgi:hypothetical protein